MAETTAGQFTMILCRMPARLVQLKSKMPSEKKMQAYSFKTFFKRLVPK